MSHIICVTFVDRVVWDNSHVEWTISEFFVRDIFTWNHLIWNLLTSNFLTSNRLIRSSWKIPFRQTS